MDRYDAPGEQHETRIEDGIVYLEGPDGSVEMGPLDTIVDLVGGETYVIEYDATDAALYDWLDSDDPELEIDVRETVTSFSYPAEFVRALENVPLKDADSSSKRAERFAHLVTTIWDEKGNVDLSAE